MMLTGYMDVLNKEELENSTDNNYIITKPWKAEILKAKVEQAISYYVLKRFVFNISKKSTDLVLSS